MKRLALAFPALFSVFFAAAQGIKPKSVTLSSSTDHASVGDTIELILTAIPPDGFHIYSEKSTCPADAGSMRAELTFTGQGFEPVDDAYGVGYEMITDELASYDNVDCKIGIFNHDAVFRQKIRIVGPIADLKCDLFGQMCDNEQCIMIRETVKLNSEISISVVKGQ